MVLHEGTICSTDAVAAAPPRRFPFVLAIAANVLALALFTVAPHAAEYPVAALGIAAFLLAQLLLPACRPVTESPLCPGNVAQAFFWVQLVLVALLIGFFGIREGVLPYLPSVAAINTAVCLRVVGYLAFSVAYQCAAGRAARGEARRTASPPAAPTATWLVIVAFLGLGLIGQSLAYENLTEFVHFASSPVQQREREAQTTTLAAAASMFLRPFLGFGLVWLWSWWLHRADRPRSLTAAIAATAPLLLGLLVANFSYNRGSMVVPLLAVAAAFSVHIRRVPFVAVAVAGTVALFAVLVFGWYRTTDLEIGELATADLHEAWSEEEVTEFFQIYASGPQMTAYLIEQQGDGSWYGGRTLLCSALYPVPVLGKAFREESGVSILNRLIYQDPEVVDQIIAYDAELYLNFGVPGVLAGYALLGWLLCRFQNRFLRAPHAIESYIWLTLAFWLVFPGSLAVVSQMGVYFFWPVYAYFAVKAFGVLNSRAADEVASLRGLCRP